MNELLAVVLFLLGGAFTVLVLITASGVWLPGAMTRILARMTPEQLAALADKVAEERTRGAA